MIRLIATALLIFPLTAPAASGLDTDELTKKLQQKFPGRQVQDIEPSPIDGIYQLSLEGAVLYTDGDYLIQGDIFDLDTMSNLTKLNMIDSISDSDTVAFTPEKGADHTITVFTDTTCGYCRKLHQEVDKLNEAGIQVRYMLYPRAGLGSPAAQTLESVWCADNPQKAMTQAKAGKQIPEKSCENPIQEHIDLAHRMGLRGTPLIVTDKGHVINGYKPADQLIQDLN